MLMDDWSSEAWNSSYILPNSTQTTESSMDKVFIIIKPRSTNFDLQQCRLDSLAILVVVFFSMMCPLVLLDFDIAYQAK